MKNLLLFALLAISTITTAQAEDIKVRSVERQFDKSSAPITKSSAGTAIQQGSVESSPAQQKHAIKQAQPSLKRAIGELRSDDPDFWIYDAFITLNVDEDFDGFYSNFSVEFDADTVFTNAGVYARLYLSRGSVFEEFHTTSIFFIEGDSSQDGFVVDSELLSGFPPGDYELLIELYDSIDDALVATFDGTNDADLTFISLESKTFEDDGTVIIVEEGGSFGYLVLLVLPILIRRQIRRC